MVVAGHEWNKERGVMVFERLNPDTLHKNLAFTQVAVVSSRAKLVFVGGQNAVNAKGEIVGKDIASQTEQAYRNVIAALEAAGATLHDVFKMTIYIVQGQSLQEGFAAAQRVMGDGVPPPTVSGVFVAGLAHPDFLIEIEAVAAIGEGGEG
jgi:enamine deaminase RidA (YjgF/YER057c/UK114 family)